MAKNLPEQHERYSAADWERVPGSARQYALRDNPEVTISRRAFDQTYGRIAQQGYQTYEQMRTRRAELQIPAEVRLLSKTQYDRARSEIAIYSVPKSAATDPARFLQVVRQLNPNAKGVSLVIAYRQGGKTRYMSTPLTGDADQLKKEFEALSDRYAVRQVQSVQLQSISYY